MFLTRLVLNLVVLAGALALAACATSPAPAPTRQPAAAATTPAAADTAEPTTPATPTVATETPSSTPVPPTPTTPAPTATPRPPAISVDNAARLVQVAARDFEYVRGGIYGLAWSPDLPAPADGPTLAVSSKLPRGITLYEPHLTAGRFISTDAVMYKPAFSPDGTLLAAGGADNAVRVWETGQPGDARYTFTAHTQPAWANAAFSPDGRWLASGGMDETAILWPLDSQAGSQPRLLQHAGYVDHLAFSPSGHLLAASSGNTLYLWKVASLSTTGSQPAGVLQALTTGSPLICFLDDERLITAGLASPLRVWRLAQSGETVNGHLERTLPYDNVSSLVVNPGGTLLAVANLSQPSIHLVSLSTGEVVHYLDLQPDESPIALAFSSDGAWLAAATDRPEDNISTVRVWGLEGDER